MKLRWNKKLSHADAQHPRGANTNPTAHLTLVQAGHAIDSATWFRQVLFADLPWGGVPGKERLTLPMRVSINGTNYGLQDIEVTHTPSFEANQGNRATVLHWGVLGPVLQGVDLSSQFVTIERGPADEFYLTIDSKPTGPSRV
jgi:hypothetical protein